MMLQKFILFIFVIILLGCNFEPSVDFGLNFSYKLSSLEREVGLTPEYHSLYEKYCAFENSNVIMNKLIISNISEYVFIGIPYSTTFDKLESELINSNKYNILDKRELLVSAMKAQLYLVEREQLVQVKLFIEKANDSAVLTYFDSNPEKAKQLFLDEKYFTERIK
jgi:hypothetical protein